MTQAEISYCGLAAIVGRPNVGKSTLLNQLVGEKIAATSRKAQTTRHRIRGIITEAQRQLVLVDTPGLDPDTPKLLGRVLNETARAALADVDVIVFVVEADRWEAGDENLATLIAPQTQPVLVVVNKIDRLKDKSRLLPFLQRLGERLPQAEFLPVSALSASGLDRLLEKLMALLPEGPMLFPEDEITDRPQRFRVSEVIREEILERLGQEVPYATAVEVEQWQDSGRSLHIGAVIYVERESQKAIVLGKGGRMIKAIGMGARQTLEAMLERKVMLSLHVRLREGWQRDIESIRRMGIDIGT